MTLPDTFRGEGTSLARLEAWRHPWTWLRLSPLYDFVCGRPAVILFFVLSGFVLTLPFVHGVAQSYGRFLTRRFFRLYPPLVVVVLVSALLQIVIMVGPIDGVSHWFNRESWSVPPTAGVVVSHLILDWQRFSLDNAIWSLVPEVRISVIFPILVYCAMSGTAWSLAVGVALYLLAGVLDRLGFGPGIGDLSVTIRFVLFFVIGVSLAIHLDRVRGFATRLSGRARLAGWIGALALVALPELAPSVDLAYGVAAATVILLALSSQRAARLLERPSIEWLGRVSYSLYLVHLVVIVTMVHLLAGHVPLALILAAAVVISLLAAHVLYYCIEAPSMALGRYLSTVAPATTAIPRR